MSTVVIDKGRVRRSFSRQAHVYEQNAHMQREVAGKLATLIVSDLSKVSENGSLISMKSAACRLKKLDIGIGTGFATSILAEQVSDAGFFGCDIASGMLDIARKTGALLTGGDADNLPFNSDSFDIVFSSLALQWTNLQDSLSEAYRVMRSGGSFYLATFGEATLSELSDSYAAAFKIAGLSGVFPLLRFIPGDRLRDLMIAIGFKDAWIRKEIIKTVYPSPIALIKSLKDLGAGNHSRGIYTARGLLNDTCRIYEEDHREVSGIIATYEVIYAGGVK